jgi:tRNA dimethylallyltransferase
MAQRIRRPRSVPHYTARDSLYPLVVIVGPSASGKSDLALAAAERFGGEIINFDSVQVYRHFDIGSAKTPLAERRGVPHHLIDIVEPAAAFTAGNYARLARKAIADVRARGGLPVMAGGTGLYLRAALQGLFQGPERDEMLRLRLEKRAASRPPGYLNRLLTRLDATSAGRIHANDTPKLIRALEVCLRGRAPMSRQWEQNAERPLGGCEVIRIGLNPPRAALYERIARRSEKMFITFRRMASTGSRSPTWASISTRTPSKRATRSSCSWTAARSFASRWAAWRTSASSIGPARTGGPRSRRGSRISRSWWRPARATLPWRSSSAPAPNRTGSCRS